MDTWKLKDMIKNGTINYKKGDVVVVFRRKANGYPKNLIDGQDYVVISFGDEDRLELLNLKDYQSKVNTKCIKVHKSFIIPKTILRDIKIDEILKF